MGRKKIILIFSLFWFFLLFQGRSTFSAEPSLPDYTAYPIFQVNAIEPNILIILDNSASMNLQAYIL